jgi:hypothetical protein
LDGSTVGIRGDPNVETRLTLHIEAFDHFGDAPAVVVGQRQVAAD